MSNELTYINGDTSNLRIKSNMKVDLVEYISDSKPAREITIEEGAVFNHYQLISANVHDTVKIMRNATYNNFLFPASDSNVKKIAKLEEKNAKAEINAAYLIKDKETIKLTTLIEHLVPHTFSNQLIKCVAGGFAKSTFDGKIHIAKDAIGSEGRQLHKSLLLSDKAEINFKPELEIFADDVKCSHGAAAGLLDEMQLFYLCSRGISFDDAKQILINAYLADVIDKIENIDVQKLVETGFGNKDAGKSLL